MPREKKNYNYWLMKEGRKKKTRKRNKGKKECEENYQKEKTYNAINRK